MRIGFIGLGNVGGKLAGSILRNGLDLTVRDLDQSAAQHLLDAGASWAESPKQMAERCDVVITCLPSPAASAHVLEDVSKTANDRKISPHRMLRLGDVNDE